MQSFTVLSIIACTYSLHALHLWWARQFFYNFSFHAQNELRIKLWKMFMIEIFNWHVSRKFSLHYSAFLSRMKFSYWFLSFLPEHRTSRKLKEVKLANARTNFILGHFMPVSALFYQTAVGGLSLYWLQRCQFCILNNPG